MGGGYDERNSWAYGPESDQGQLIWVEWKLWSSVLRAQPAALRLASFSGRTRGPEPMRFG